MRMVLYSGYIRELTLEDSQIQTSGEYILVLSGFYHINRVSVVDDLRLRLKLDPLFGRLLCPYNAAMKIKNNNFYSVK